MYFSNHVISVMLSKYLLYANERIPLFKGEIIKTKHVRKNKRHRNTPLVEI